jgi:hypothetical protein
MRGFKGDKDRGDTGGAGSVRFNESSLSGGKLIDESSMKLGLRNLNDKRKDESSLQNRLLGRQSADLDYRFKVILLGDSKVGKSCIVRRIVDETFNLKYSETYIFDMVNKLVVIDNL